MRVSLRREMLFENDIFLLVTQLHSAHLHSSAGPQSGSLAGMGLDSLQQGVMKTSGLSGWWWQCQERWASKAGARGYDGDQESRSDADSCTRRGLTQSAVSLELLLQRFSFSYNDTADKHAV
ncbi:hypothetical protein MHYP_G00160760 [Metynnis hypsauchen]